MIVRGRKYNFTLLSAAAFTKQKYEPTVLLHFVSEKTKLTSGGNVMQLLYEYNFTLSAVVFSVTRYKNGKTQLRLGNRGEILFCAVKKNMGGSM